MSKETIKRKTIKKRIIESFPKKTCGSADVQIAIFQEEIRRITEHLRKNPKDFSAQRGLKLIIGKLKGMEKYKKKEENKQFNLEVNLKSRPK